MKLQAAKRIVRSITKGAPILCIVEHPSIGVAEHSGGYSRALLQTLISSFAMSVEGHDVALFMMISREAATRENLEYLRSIGVTIWYVDHFKDEATGIGNVLDDRLYLASPGWNSISGHWVVDAPRPPHNTYAYVKVLTEALHREAYHISCEAGFHNHTIIQREINNHDYTSLSYVGKELSFGKADLTHLKSCGKQIKKLLGGLDDQFKWRNQAHVAKWNEYADDSKILPEVDAMGQKIGEELSVVRALLTLYKARLYADGDEEIKNSNSLGYPWNRALSEGRLEKFEELGGREMSSLCLEGIPVEDILGQYGRVSA